MAHKQLYSCVLAIYGVNIETHSTEICAASSLRAGGFERPKGVASRSIHSADPLGKTPTEG